MVSLCIMGMDICWNEILLAYALVTVESYDNYCFFFELVSRLKHLFEWMCKRHPPRRRLPAFIVIE